MTHFLNTFCTVSHPFKIQNSSLMEASVSLNFIVMHSLMPFLDYKMDDELVTTMDSLFEMKV